MMKGQSDSSGILPLDNFWQITPKGTIQEARFPDNQAFNMTHVIWYFAATNTQFTVRWNYGSGLITPLR